jgi:hypothetical protein
LARLQELAFAPACLAGFGGGDILNIITFISSIPLIKEIFILGFYFVSSLGSFLLFTLTLNLIYISFMILLASRANKESLKK